MDGLPGQGSRRGVCRFGPKTRRQLRSQIHSPGICPMAAQNQLPLDKSNSLSGCSAMLCKWHRKPANQIRYPSACKVVQDMARGSHQHARLVSKRVLPALHCDPSTHNMHILTHHTVTQLPCECFVKRHTHTHTHSYSHTPKHTHTYAHTHTHIHTHEIHTHTHTHIAHSCATHVITILICDLALNADQYAVGCHVCSISMWCFVNIYTHTHPAHPHAPCTYSHHAHTHIHTHTHCTLMCHSCDYHPHLIFGFG